MHRIRDPSTKAPSHHASKSAHARAHNRVFSGRVSRTSRAKTDSRTSARSGSLHATQRDESRDTTNVLGRHLPGEYLHFLIHKENTAAREQRETTFFHKQLFNSRCCYCRAFVVVSTVAGQTSDPTTVRRQEFRAAVKAAKPPYLPNHLSDPIWTKKHRQWP